jgi:hypothetical protein
VATRNSGVSEPSSDSSGCSSRSDDGSSEYDPKEVRLYDSKEELSSMPGAVSMVGDRLASSPAATVATRNSVVSSSESVFQKKKLAALQPNKTVGMN